MPFLERRFITRDDSRRRLRGAFGNALVWGGGWFVAAITVITLLHIAGVASDRFTWLGALGLAIKFGIIGFISGGAFAAVIRLLYRGRRLSEISWVRFGLVGGVATGVFVPLFLQTMNLLSGDGLVPWNLVLDDGVTTALFGGAAAAASVKIAQRAKAARAGDGRDRVVAAPWAAPIGTAPATAKVAACEECRRKSATFESHRRAD